MKRIRKRNPNRTWPFKFTTPGHFLNLPPNELRDFVCRCLELTPNGQDDPLFDALIKVAKEKGINAFWKTIHFILLRWEAEKKLERLKEQQTVSC